MFSFTFQGLSEMGFTALLLFVGFILLVRINGLRTFAKMSSFDFAITIAIGSILASTIVASTGLIEGLFAIAVIILLQRLFTFLKRRFNRFQKVATNQPILLMRGEEMLYDNLALNNIEESEVLAKLREANVYAFEQVLYVVLETTGDISVLHSSDKDASVDDGILIGVRKTP